MRAFRASVFSALLALITGTTPMLFLADPVEAHSARLIAAYNGVGQRQGDRWPSAACADQQGN